MDTNSLGNEFCMQKHNLEYKVFDNITFKAYIYTHSFITSAGKC